MKNQVIILAAGKGTRMGEANVPKVLVPLKGKAIILYLLEELNKIKDLIEPVIVVGFKSNAVKEVLGESYKYAEQKDQLGTAHAVVAAKDSINAENVVVLYGDMPFVSAESLEQLIALHTKENSAITLCTTVVPSFEGMFASMEFYGRIIRDTPPSIGGDRGGIIKITEFKDATEEEKNIKEVNPGIYIFNSHWLWSNIDKITNNNAQGEYYLTDIVELAIGQGLKIHSLSIVPEEVFGINTKSHLEEAEKLLAK